MTAKTVGPRSRIDGLPFSGCRRQGRVRVGSNQDGLIGTIGTFPRVNDGEVGFLTRCMVHPSSISQVRHDEGSGEKRSNQHVKQTRRQKVGEERIGSDRETEGGRYDDMPETTRSKSLTKKLIDKEDNWTLVRAMIQSKENKETRNQVRMPTIRC